MKRILIIIVLIILAWASEVHSQNTMRIDTLKGKPGDTLTFSLKVNNSQSFVAFQADIVLPSQLSYINNSAVLTGRSNGHMLAVTEVSTGRIRVLSYSLNLSKFLGDTGAVMTFKTVAGTVHGGYNLFLQSPLIADSVNNNILTGFYNGYFTLNAPAIGFNVSTVDFGRTVLGQNKDFDLVIRNDGNDSLIVTRLSSTNPDIQFIDSSGFVLTTGSTRLRKVRMYASSKGLKTADLLFYTNVTGNIVKQLPARGVVFTQNELHLNNLEIKYGLNGTVKLRMKNFESVNAFQLTVPLNSALVYLPGSIALNPQRRTDHVISASVNQQNELKILSYSPTNQPYTGNDSTIAEFILKAAGTAGIYPLTINGGVISDTTGQNILSDVFSGSFKILSPIINTTNSITFDSTRYDTSSYKLLNIQNTGTETLIITGITSSDSSFKNISSVPSSILPGNSKQFTIKFSNPTRGFYNGNLIIESNDSLQNPKVVQVSGRIYKPNNLYVNNARFVARDTSYVSFSISNIEKFVAFQFDVTLPPQITAIPNSALISGRGNGHQVHMNLLPNGDVRVIAFSLTQNVFSGDTGEVVRFKAAANIDTGIYNVAAKNLIISDSLNVNIAHTIVNGRITVNPYPPVLISPTNGATGFLNETQLIWQKSLYVKKYKLQLAIDSLFSSIIVNDSTLTDTIRTVSSLTPLTFYYWRVKIKTNSGESDYSQVFRFKTLGKPTQALLVYPPPDTLNMPVNITFYWRKSVDQFIKNNLTVNKYWFEISTDSLFANSVIDTTLTDTLKYAAGLLHNKYYYWRIKAKNEMGWGQYSAANKFKTITLNTQVSVFTGWNILSVPVISSSMRLDSLFPGAVSQAFAYNNGYVITTTLTNSKGYWVKFSGANSYGISGTNISPQVIPVTAGWNLIGGYENEVNVSGITTEPAGIISSSFFSYNNGYLSSQVLTAGKGYWVKTTQAGTLLLPGSGDNPDNREIEKLRQKETAASNDWIKVTIKDKLNRKSELYLAKSIENPDKYELPPVPPLGIFDARFESDRIAEISGTGSHNIKILSAEYPVTITAENLKGNELILKDRVNGKIVNEIIKEGKVITISQPVELFELTDQNDLPDKYQLEQNYPNPFNPVTTIKYQIPEDAVVRIAVFDILGREVRTLVNSRQTAGYYKINFNANGLSSGTYFYRLYAGNYSSIKKMIILK